MKINSQLPLIYNPSQQLTLSADSAVNSASPPQNEFITQQVRPVTWAENLDRARNYTLNAQDSNKPLGRHEKEALSAYASHDRHTERDYLAKVFGIDTYA